MKRLIKTEELLKNNLNKGVFTDYALVIGFREDEWIYTSENVDLDTYFDAASVGKVFPTSTLALQAVSKGLLSLEDTLEKFFNNVPEDKKNITVKQLLTHTSGIVRYDFPENVADRGRESIIDFVLSRPLAFKPGEYYAYSCNAFLLLGFIIEKVYGMGLDAVFKKYIMEPLGMERSKYNIANDEENAAICYTHSLKLEHPWDDCNVRKMKGIPAGNGGNFCTAGDLKKFVKAILNKDERLYSKELFDLAEKNHTADIEAWPGYFVYGNHGFGYEYIDSKCSSPKTLSKEVFPDGSVGKVGWTGQSFFLNRERNLYVILLTNATRCTALKYGDARYEEVCSMRQEIHSAIKEDLSGEGEPIW